MAKFLVYVPAFAGATYTVEADNEDEARDLALEQANEVDLEFLEWDYDAIDVDFLPPEKNLQ